MYADSTDVNITIKINRLMYFLISMATGCQLDVKYYSEKEPNKRPILVWRDQLTDVSSKKNVSVLTYFRSSGRPFSYKLPQLLPVLCSYSLELGCQKMTKTCLKIRLCLNARSELWLSDISISVTNIRHWHRERQEGGAMPARAEIELRQGGLGTAQHRTAHHTAPHHTAPHHTPQLTLRLSVCPWSRPVLTRPGRHITHTGAAGWEPVRCLEWEDERRWEEPGNLLLLLIILILLLLLPVSVSVPSVSLYSLDLLALLIFC